MPTIGRRWPRHARGVAAAHCGICGVRWRRDQLVRDGAGRLVCPDDQRGRDEVTLDELNAQSAAEYAERRHYDEDPGSYFATDTSEPTPQRTTRDDI